jgi:ankyrin repeat protein
MSGNVIAADDLLPVIMFLIIKTNLPNWIAHLTYMKQFRFSSCYACHFDEYSFLITTLEAAIEHIKSGILLGPSVPEAQYVYESQNDDGCDTLGMKDTKMDKSGRLAAAETSCVTYFFDQIRLGNLEKVQEILSRSQGNTKCTDSRSVKNNEDLLPHLCHPLCSCDKCESLLNKSICDTTPTVNSCDDRGFTALHVACLFGRPLIVEVLLCSGSNVNALDYSGSTPLHYAAAKGHQNALLLLLHSGAIINIFDNDGNTPLHQASNNGHEVCVKTLLYFAEHTDSKLDVNSQNTNGDTPLHRAARWGYESIVQILLEYGGRPDVENKRHITPMDSAHNLHVSKLLINVSKTVCSAESEACHKELKNYAEEEYVDIAPTTKPTLDFTDDSLKSSNGLVNEPRKKRHGISPQSTEQMKKVERLLRTIACGDTRLACFYLGLDGPVSTSSSCKVHPPLNIKSLCHPLCTCEKCKPDDSDIFQDGLKQNKDILNINVCNSDGFTPLHIASMHGHVDMMRLLLDAGAGINVVTRTKGMTPLHLACQNQWIQAAKLLLESGDCNPDIQDSGGNTALHCATSTGNSKLVEMILKHSPVQDIRNSSGKTPLEEAEEKMLLAVVRLLRDENSSISLPWDENKEV